MPLFSRAVFAVVRFAARRGLAESSPEENAKQRARRTGIRGETYAYWFLRRQGYVFIARNYRTPEVKGEIDLVGYDGRVLAFVEVKTRAGGKEKLGPPEDSVTPEKRKYLDRMARRFLAEWGLGAVPWRFDVVAIESPLSRAPVVRLHKGALVGGR